MCLFRAHQCSQISLNGVAQHDLSVIVRPILIGGVQDFSPSESVIGYRTLQKKMNFVDPWYGFDKD
jgi:hypothetical protein